MYSEDDTKKKRIGNSITFPLLCQPAELRDALLAYQRQSIEQQTLSNIIRTFSPEAVATLSQNSASVTWVTLLAQSVLPSWSFFTILSKNPLPSPSHSATVVPGNTRDEATPKRIPVALRLWDDDDDASRETASLMRRTCCCCRPALLPLWRLALAVALIKILLFMVVGGGWLTRNGIE